MAAISEYIAQINTQLNSAGFTSQMTKLLDRDYYVDIKTRMATTTTSGIDQFGRQMTTVSKGVVDANGNIVKATESITSMNTTTHKMSQSFTSILGKVVKFGAATALIGLFTTGVTQAVQSVKEFDDSLTQFKKVSDLSGSALDNYTKKLGETGVEVGRTRAEMVDAATEFKKSGFTDEDSAKLAKVATMYQNVADSEMTAGDSAGFITSQMKAFNINANDAQHIIDATNEV